MPSFNQRFMVVMVLSFILIGIELQGDLLKDVKSHLSVITYPIRSSIILPNQLCEFVSNYFFKRAKVLTENNNLKEQNLYYKSQLQKFYALEIENKTLRKLLAFRESKSEDMLIASIVKINSDPFSHLVVINKGKKHGAYVGQPVIDGNGLMGNVVEVSSHTSVLLLLTDHSNLVPVVNLRNGLRGITEGQGRSGVLELKYVTNTSDVRVGDKFVTSGLGRKYPEGYHVGEVIDIVNSASAQFSKIILKPAAKLSSSKLVLLLNPQVVFQQE